MKGSNGSFHWGAVRTAVFVKDPGEGFAWFDEATNTTGLG